MRLISGHVSKEIGQANIENWNACNEIYTKTRNISFRKNHATEQLLLYKKVTSSDLPFKSIKMRVL